MVINNSLTNVQCVPKIIPNVFNCYLNKHCPILIIFFHLHYYEIGQLKAGLHSHLT